MQTAAAVVFTILRVAWVVQIVLGFLFWSGNGLALIPVHMRVGFVVVLSLWILALLAARAGVSMAAVALALAWGLVVPIVGLTQARILPGQYHLIVQIVHLLLGLGALGIGERLYERIRTDTRVMGHG